MPNLKNRPPKYQRSGKYAVVYYHGKRNFLGLYGSQESKVAYARFVAEIQANPTLIISKGETKVTVKELTAAFLDHVEATADSKTYSHYGVIVLDFLNKLYGDGTPVEDFKPSSLKLVRESMIQSRRFCRKLVNKYANLIISIFGWGVESELVPETTWRALKAVKSLPEGYPGSFDNAEREPVPDDVLRRTLPFMPPVLRAMVVVQYLTGSRPGEIFRMRVGEIDTTRGNGLWYYVPKHHKTEKYIGKKEIPLGRPEQKLIAPYLVGKKPDAAVFSPRTAQEERNAERRVNRKSKIPPSQIARDKARAAKPTRYSEFYNGDSYRQAVEHAIKKGNRQLPEDKQIPHWYPYLLRNSAATVTELAHSDEDAQALLGHTTVNMTKRYSKTQKTRREKLARKRINPFDTDGLADDRAVG
jgi:integrase